MGTNNLYYHYTRYTIRCKKKEIPFDLSLEIFTFLCNKNCFYCEAKPRPIHPNRWNHEVLANGLDRVIPELGYVLGNVVPCCSVCNSMKSDMTLSNFLEKIVAVFNSSLK